MLALEGWIASRSGLVYVSERVNCLDNTRLCIVVVEGEVGCMENERTAGLNDSTVNLLAGLKSIVGSLLSLPAMILMLFRVRDTKVDKINDFI